MEQNSDDIPLKIVLQERDNNPASSPLKKEWA